MVQGGAAVALFGIWLLLTDRQLLRGVRQLRRLGRQARSERDESDEELPMSGSLGPGL